MISLIEIIYYDKLVRNNFDVIISFNRGLTSGGDKSGVLVMCVRLSNIVLLEFFASNDAMKNYMYINPGTS